MTDSFRRGWRAIKTAAVVFAADQLCKSCVENKLPVGTRLPLRGDPEGTGRADIVLQHVKNRGFALNRLDRHPRLIKVVSGAVSAAMTAAFAESVIRGGDDPLYQTGLALVTGGGLSNTADRLLKGEVTDYLTFQRKHGRNKREVVYNAADLAIFAGSAIMLFAQLKRRGERK